MRTHDLDQAMPAGQPSAFAAMEKSKRRGGSRFAVIAMRGRMVHDDRRAPSIEMG
jgi:hypothetical protein